MATATACVYLERALQRPSPKRPWDGHTMPCDRLLPAKHGGMTMNNNRWRKPWGWRCRARASTLYDLLSVPQGVDLAGIKSAYRQLVKMYHPDVCPAVNRRDFSQKFLQVQEAYETLSDPLLRATYDDGLLHNYDDKYGVTAVPPGHVTWEYQLLGLHQKRSRGHADDTWGGRMRRLNRQMP